ncbi:MAG: FAD:protein FMN transferase [Gammaproteobacteria bacterium]
MKFRYSAWAKLLWLTITLYTAACTSQQESLVRRQFFAFGTLVEISLYEVQQPLADQAFAAAEADFQRMHQQWHAWHPSKVTDVNRRIAEGELAMVPPELLSLITEAKHLSLLSNGLFNPAIGRLVRLWGFQQDNFSATQPPDPKIVYGLLRKRPSMEDLTIDDGTISSRNPAVQFDLGAVAKGFGIDRVIEHLRSLGVHNAIVNCGGDLRAIGRHGTRPWRIGIRSPRGAGVLASLELSEDESVFTSGDYERFFESGGKRYHHILDPRTGYPAQHVTSVTVAHHDATTADAAATALFVAGPDDWQSIARRMGVRYVMLVDRHGTVHMNPAMAARVQFEVDPLPQQEISKSL